MADGDGEQKRLKVQHHGRYFAAGVRATPSYHYFVAPVVTALVTDMVQNKYCLLTGDRQSGKSTTIDYATVQAAEQTGAVPVTLDGGIPDAKTEDEMWQCLLADLNLACPEHFPRVDFSRTYSSSDFVTAFKVPGVKFILVIDEADTLLRLEDVCVDSLMHAMRSIKSRPEEYSLQSVVLVGTDYVKDLAEERYHAAPRRPGYSPFPHDRALESVRFSAEDIRQLLRQFATDFPRKRVEVDAIAESIFELTAGHKGLAGTCLAYMDQEQAYSLVQWNALVSNHSLWTHVFSLGTYRRIMQAVKGMSSNNLRKFVEQDRVRYDLDVGPVQLRQYLASGVLIAEPEPPYCYLKLSSPLLRMAILSKVMVSNHTLDKKPPSVMLTSEEDRLWVLERSLELMDGSMLKAPENRSEYAFQSAFMARLRLVLEQAYQFMELKVLPEVREVRVPGVTRSRLRADTLVTGGSNFQMFGFKFVVGGKLGTLREHYEKSLRYAQQHSAIMYLVSITMDEACNELVPESPSVVFVGVEFKSDANVAQVKVLYSAEAGNREMMLNLERWNGELSYALVL